MVQTHTGCRGRTSSRTVRPNRSDPRHARNVIRRTLLRSTFRPSPYASKFDAHAILGHDHRSVIDAQRRPARREEWLGRDDQTFTQPHLAACGAAWRSAASRTGRCRVIFAEFRGSRTLRRGAQRPAAQAGGPAGSQSGSTMPKVPTRLSLPLNGSGSVPGSTFQAGAFADLEQTRACGHREAPTIVTDVERSFVGRA